VTIPPLPAVQGLSLDGPAPVVIDAAENRALCATMGVEPDADGRRTPAIFYIATQVGMGLSVAELRAACAFDVTDGPMMATSGAKLHSPLMTGQPYLMCGNNCELVLHVEGRAVLTGTAALRVP
jgi:hypothetical protein